MKLHNELYGVETVNFNIYGKRQSATSDYSGVITIFVQKFKDNKIPNIYGKREQSRDFVYVEKYIKAMNIQNISGDFLCMGTANKTCIHDLIDILNVKYKKNIKANYLEERSGDIKESIYIHSKIKKIFEFNNFMKFKEEIF